MAHREPYAEHAASANGQALYALQNLTREDVAQLLEAILSRRLIHTLRLQDGASPNVAAQLQRQAARLDLLHCALKSTLHHEPATDRKTE